MSAKKRAKRANGKTPAPPTPEQLAAARAILDARFPALPQIFTFDQSRARSAMFQQKILCNGQATGCCCKHYWALTRVIPSATPHLLKHGEKVRMCRAFGSAEPLEFDDGGEGMAVTCNIFEPDVARPYDEKFEEYDPITEAELAEYDPITEAELAELEGKDGAPSPSPSEPSVSLDQVMED